MAIFSSLDFWMPLFVVAGLVVVFRGGFRARAMILCLLVSVGLMEGIVINPLKKSFGRPRPNEVLSSARTISIAPPPQTPGTQPPESSLWQKAGNFLSSTTQVRAIANPPRSRPAQIGVTPKRGKSFPSGHTANMFCFATVLTAFYGWRGAPSFVIAALVAISRIATGSHWPSDVIFTAVLSVIITSAFLALYARLWRKLAPRFVPGIAAKHPELIERL